MGGRMKCAQQPVAADGATGSPEPVRWRFQTGAVAVALDPDVASVFGSSQTVNAFLRSISAIPDRGRRRAKAG
jgi:hypothetical protein